jgi:hypothetical protein
VRDDSEQCEREGPFEKPALHAHFEHAGDAEEFSELDTGGFVFVQGLLLLVSLPSSSSNWVVWLCGGKSACEWGEAGAFLSFFSFSFCFFFFLLLFFRAKLVLFFFLNGRVYI